MAALMEGASPTRELSDERGQRLPDLLARADHDESSKAVVAGGNTIRIPRAKDAVPLHHSLLGEAETPVPS